MARPMLGRLSTAGEHNPKAQLAASRRSANSHSAGPPHEPSRIRVASPVRAALNTRALKGMSQASRKGDAQVAQSVEQWTENPRVVGSIPTLGTDFFGKLRHALRGSSAAATKADPPKSCKGSCGSCHFMVGLRPRAAKRSVLLRRPRRIREMTTRVFAQSCASEQRKGAPTT